MPSRIEPGPVGADACIREAVCIHTSKIYDSCRDRDCLEDLRVYLTSTSQCAVENAVSVRARCADLICAVPEVQPVCFNRGYYTVDTRFFYRIRGEAVTVSGISVPITGLSVFDKRVLLFGSEGNVRSFSSKDVTVPLTRHALEQGELPTAYVEAVDPIVLDMKLIDGCQTTDCEVVEVPSYIAAAFDAPLVTDGQSRRLTVTLGQFTIVRLERDSQLLIPAYDYCLPGKACDAGAAGDDPCTVFSRIEFPVDEFFPPDTMNCPDDYRGMLEDISE